MQKLLMIFMISFYTLHLKAQNLISNPGFEEQYQCPTTLNQWGHIKNWYNPTSSSPDYFHACNNAINGDVGVPQHMGSGYQYPHSGDGYLGLILANWPLGTPLVPHNYREYILTPLLSPLIPGKRYCVSFYIAVNKNVRYAIDRIGAYFSVDSVYVPGLITLPFTPQAMNPPGNILSDTSGWAKMAWEFIADSAYRYMTIGNFYDYNNTDTQRIRVTAPSNTNFIYYYFDDFAVYPIPEQDFMKDTVMYCNTPVVVSSDVYESCLWSTGETTNSITISSPGNYWLEVVTGCGTYWDSFSVINIDTTSISFILPDLAMICNAPVTASGGIYTSYIWSTGETASSININTPGNYWLTVSNNCGTYSDSFSVKNIDTTTVPFSMPDGYIFCRRAILLSPGTYGSYLWSTGETNSSITVSDPGKYWLTATNNCGAYTDTFHMTDAGCFYIPNAFTPDKNGLNDVFCPRGIRSAQHYGFYIYNRWGEQVFASDEVNTGWNGQYKNAPCGIGVYYWYLKYTYEGNEVFKKGEVTLLR